jgi:hypothetical protein
MSRTVFRWQDAHGRGPYKPGVSHYWADEDHAQRCLPPFFQEFGMEIVNQRRLGEALGCGFSSVEQMHRWFTSAEQVRMRLMGYEFGSLEADRVLAESAQQLVFARRRPLHVGFKRIEGEA